MPIRRLLAASCVAAAGLVLCAAPAQAAPLDNPKNAADTYAVDCGAGPQEVIPAPASVHQNWASAFIPATHQVLLPLRIDFDGFGTISHGGPVPADAQVCRFLIDGQDLGVITFVIRGH